MNTGLFLIEISSWVISIKEEKVMVEKSFQTNPKYKDRLFCMIFGNLRECELRMQLILRYSIA